MGRRGGVYRELFFYQYAVPMGRCGSCYDAFFIVCRPDGTAYYKKRAPLETNSNGAKKLLRKEIN